MPSVNAHVTKIEHDVSTGWFRIATDDPTVKRLDTKRAEIAHQAAAFKQSGALAALEFTQNTRTLDDGRTFENFYLERAVAAQAALPMTNGDSAIETITPTMRKTEPGDAWRITLAASAKLAVGCIPVLEKGGYELNLEALQRLALTWAEFLWTTPAPGAQPEPSFTSTGGGDSFTDSDIPFMPTV